MYVTVPDKKFSPPRIPAKILHRTPLIQTLHKIINDDTSTNTITLYRLILLVAPAGYGKTVLLADFAQHTATPCCWCFLDASDTSPEAFIRLLLASIHRCFPQFETSFEKQLDSIVVETTNQDTHLIYLEQLITTITTSIANTILNPFALFLCNYHEVNESKSTKLIVNLLLRYLPSHVLVIIESRSVPSLELAPLAVQRQLFGLGKNDLRLTASELQTLAQLQGIAHFSDNEAEQLVTAFDGWITGLLLGTRLGGILNIPTSKNTKGIATLSTHQQHLLSYFREEVFKQEQEAFTFLQETSIVPHITPEICKTLFGVSDAIDILQRAEQRGLFISRQPDDDPAVYTIHPILRDLLYIEYKYKNNERVCTLHKRMANQLYDVGDYELAIHHALMGEDYALAQKCIEDIAPSMLRLRRYDTLDHWINQLPQTLYLQSPRLQFSRAMILEEQNDREQVLPLLIHVQLLTEQEISNVPEKEDMRLLLAEIYIARANEHFKEGEYQQAQQLCTQALTLLPINERALRARAHQQSGMCFCLRGDILEGIAQMQQALQLWGHRTEIVHTALLHGYLANAYDLIGNYALAEHHRARAITSCDRLGDKEGKITNLIGMAITRRNRNALNDAESILQEALEMSRSIKSSKGEAYALVNLSELYQDQDQFAKSLTFMEDALALAQPLQDSHLLNSALCTQALTYLFMGDPYTATLFIQQIKIKESGSSVTSYASALRALTESIIHFYQQNYEKALTLIKAAQPALEKAHLKRLYLRAFIRQSACHLALRQHSLANQTWEHALHLAVQGNYEHIMQTELRRFPELATFIQTRPHNAAIQVIQESDVLLYDEPQEDSPPILSQSGTSTENIALQIFGFGEPAVCVHGTPITRWRMARSMELYFFLLAQGGPVHKERIIEGLWPDADERIDQTLRSTVFYLRKALGDGSLVYRNGTYSLNLADQYRQHIWYDVEIFEQNYTKAVQALEAGDDQEAQANFQEMVNLYRGDYVQSFYSNWCVFQRDALRRIYMDVHRELALIAWRAEDFDNSVVHWQHILVIDNCQEDAHYGLMRCYLRQQKRGLALRQYQRCVEVLREELVISPGPALRKLHQRLLAGTL